MADTLIKGATIVEGGRRQEADLRISGERISEIGRGLSARKGETVVEADGKLLMPGMIDDHVHFREPGLTDKAEIATESRAAARGGVTSFMEMPNTVPATVTKALLEEKFKRAAETSVANYSFYLGATEKNVAEIRKVDPATVCGVKLFMGASTGEMLVDKPAHLDAIFEAVPCLLAVHCESTPVVKANEERFRRLHGDSVPFSLHGQIRSAEACWQSTSQAIDLARRHGTRLHVLHVSTERELTLFSPGPLAKKRITSEATVPHLWFCDADYARLEGRIKSNPSIKSRRDRDALRHAVREGRLDLIGTDHAPHLLREKSNTYFNAPSGIPSIQEALPALLELAHKGLFSVEQVVERYSHAPATLFGIVDRGHLREGYKADVVLVDPDCPWTPTRGDTFCKCGWSPFEGERFRNKVIRTWVNGDLVWNADDPGAEVKSRGQRLEFLGRS